MIQRHPMSHRTNEKPFTKTERGFDDYFIAARRVRFGLRLFASSRRFRIEKQTAAISVNAPLSISNFVAVVSFQIDDFALPFTLPIHFIISRPDALRRACKSKNTIQIYQNRARPASVCKTKTRKQYASDPASGTIALLLPLARHSVR